MCVDRVARYRACGVGSRFKMSLFEALNPESGTVGKGPSAGERRGERARAIRIGYLRLAQTLNVRRSHNREKPRNEASRRAPTPDAVSQPASPGAALLSHLPIRPSPSCLIFRHAFSPSGLPATRYRPRARENKPPVGSFSAANSARRAADLPARKNVDMPDRLRAHRAVAAPRCGGAAPQYHVPNVAALDEKGVTLPKQENLAPVRKRNGAMHAAKCG